MNTTPSQAYLPGFEIPDLFAVDLTQEPTACVPVALATADEPSVPLVAERVEPVLNDGAPVTAATDDLLVETLHAEAAACSAGDELPTPVEATADIVHTLAPNGEGLLQDLAPTEAQLTQTAEVPAWPELTAELDAAIPSAATEKFSANIKAIAAMKAAEAEKRHPTDAERQALHRFSGWGAVADAFTSHYAWREQHDELEALIGEREMRRCSDTVLSSHYTPLWLSRAIWATVSQLGFTGGRVLDPAVGSGHFLGTAPSEIVRQSEFHACDIDPVAFGITKALYGHSATVRHAGYETLSYPEGFFDLAITNVPFADHGVPCKARKPYSKWSIHNYFAGRMLDQVRENGLVVMITSSYFLDAQTETHRKWLFNRAELVGAIRLPKGTFQGSANTEVTADVVILRKRASNEIAAASELDWITLQEGPKAVNASAAYVQNINAYWSQRPEAGVGQWTIVSTRYGNRLATTAPEGNVEQLTIAALKAFPKDVYKPRALVREVTVAQAVVDTQLRPGSFAAEFNEVKVWNGFSLEPTGLTGVRAARVTELVGVRDTLRKLIKAQTESAEDGEQDALRVELNARYDRYVAKHGYVMGRNSRLAFQADPDWPLLLSLESWDEDEQKAHKADIFSKSTAGTRPAPVSAESPEDAALISESELGHINLDYMARLLGLDNAEAAKSAALQSGTLFVNPETGHYESAAQYLSGHIRNKIKAAAAAGPAFDVNVKALEGVVPQDLPAGDIDVSMGAIWIPEDLYVSFIKSLTEDRVSVTLKLDESSAAWSLNLTGTVFSLNAKIGTSDIDAAALLASTMQSRPVTIYDVTYVDYKEVRTVNVEKTAAARAKQEEVIQAFTTWLWADADRAARLVRIYNDRFNSWVDRKYDGSRMRLPGYSGYHTPSTHQLDAAYRVSTGNNVLLGHCVGAGKSLTMQIGTMELRRLGLRRKVLHAVPNHMLEQYTGEFLRAYPNARVLMATKQDLSAERRKLFAARAATGDWDAIVMTHSGFERILPNEEDSRRVIADALSDLEATIDGFERNAANRTVLKQATKAKKQWEAKLEWLDAAWKRDTTLTMKDLGVDHVCYDESHYAKNLFRISQMQKVAGLSDSNSQRAFDLFVKTRGLMAMHGGKQAGVAFATGTFVANSLAEMHVMQRFLQPLTLREAGLEAFDAWARMFGRVVTSLEVSPDGSSFRMNERFCKFVNVPELMALFAEVADIRTKGMLKLPTPAVHGGEPQVIAVPASPKLKEYVEGLVKRAEAVKTRQVKPDVDNMLKITGDGRKAALDIRLVMPSEQFEQEGKIMAMVRKAHELWVESASFRGAQVVFCDLATPSGRGLSVYPTIRDLLVGMGVPAKEIAFIHDAKTDSAKAALFAQVRAGTIRFLLGSTGKMGVGTNVQTRLFALHHLDTPWRPADVEQREGRIERRGNTCEYVHIYRYVTSGSFDAYMWQTLAAKAGFIAQVMSGDRSLRHVEDANMTALSYEEVKAIACGNPLIREKALIDAELRKLSMLASQHGRQQRNDQFDLQLIPGRIDEINTLLAAIESDKALLLPEAARDVLAAGFEERTDEDALQMLAEAIKRGSDMVVVGSKDSTHRLGSYGGLPLYATTARWGSVALANGFVLRLGKSYHQLCTPYIRQAKLREHLMATIVARDKDVLDLQARKASLERQRTLLLARLDTPFPQAERLAELAARSTELEIELGLVTASAEAAALDENSVVASGAAADLVAEDAEVQEDADGVDEALACEALEV